MENDFRAILAGDVKLIGLVGARITPVVYEQGVAGNAVRFSKVTGADALHMQGKDGLNVSVMQVDVRASKVAEVLAIRDALRELLDPYSGLQGGTDFLLISLRDDRGVQFDTTGAQEFYTTSLDFDVHSRAAA